MKSYPLFAVSSPLMRATLLAFSVCSGASAQFALYVVDGNVEHPVAAVMDLGTVYPAETVAARFRLRNVSNAPAAVNLLKVNGSGFSLAGPAIPAGLAPQQAIDFSVAFQATATATYSASLDTEGTSVVLTAAVLTRVTCQVQTAAGPKTLDASPLAFGPVEAAGAVTKHLVMTNLTSLILPVPGIAVQGQGFSLVGFPPSGALLKPLDTAEFDIAFQPMSAGTFAGRLLIGDRIYDLAGTSLAVPLPRPLLNIDLPRAASGQQGTVRVQFDSISRAAGAGALTLDFQPLAKSASDAAIQLGVLGRSLPFPVQVGDAGAIFGDLNAVAFQTGTTAGTLIFTAELGGATDRQTVTIAPEPVTMTAVQGAKSAASIDLKIAGFDNTRTAGAVSYTFFDTAGAPIAPGTIVVDSAADFAALFAAPDSAGAFALHAVFPVTGDLSRIATFEVQIANSAGAGKTGRVSF